LALIQQIDWAQKFSRWKSWKKLRPSALGNAGGRRFLSGGLAGILE